MPRQTQSTVTPARHKIPPPIQRWFAPTARLDRRAGPECPRLEQRFMGGLLCRCLCESL